LAGKQAARSPRDFVPAGMRGLRFFIFGGKKNDGAAAMLELSAL
jgi:hypothetical protein